ncbi:MAG TPA: amidohydrolase family protein, partial [Syntrophales bacterium]|nr:amidohydrolase family protein [Syntrophales bacterium]
NAKVNPPLRGFRDVEAVKAGLRDGTIDVIASDHAPQSVIEKDVEFENAANGMVGLETSLGLSLRLVEENLLSLSDLVMKMSVNPAAILRLSGGSLRVGADADMTVIDLAQVWVVDVGTFRSKSRNSPFHGRTLKGKAFCTIVGGEIKHTEG